MGCRSHKEERGDGGRSGGYEKCGRRLGHQSFQVVGGQRDEAESGMKDAAGKCVSCKSIEKAERASSEELAEAGSSSVSTTLS